MERSCRNLRAPVRDLREAAVGRQRWMVGLLELGSSMGRTSRIGGVSTGKADGGVNEGVGSSAKLLSEVAVDREFEAFVEHVALPVCCVARSC